MDAEGIDPGCRKANDRKDIACRPEVKEIECALFQKEAQILAKRAKLYAQSFFEISVFY